MTFRRMLAVATVLAVAVIAPRAVLAGPAPLVGTLPEKGLHIDNGLLPCRDVVPDRFGAAGLTDDGRTVALDVLVLVDGLVDDGDPSVDNDLRAPEIERARALAQRHAATSAGIDLRLTYRRVHFPSAGRHTSTFYGTRESAAAGDLLSAARHHVGGAVPAGFDVVYVATAKDVFSRAADGARDHGVLGQATCVGGIESSATAFAVGEAGDAVDRDLYLLGVRGTPKVLHDISAKVLGHELGHLLGAHHHHAQCGVADPRASLSRGELSPCTLMVSDLTVASLTLGPLEQGVMRGHAFDHAR